ncbi:MAG: biotin--[acetyl-CoA-carboxylase] ligase [Leptospiraceae bacterium]|nr:biotin--[acetyl-CoA-carboxylase] ligase [Leptospiraceae bacterium]
MSKPSVFLDLDQWVRLESTDSTNQYLSESSSPSGTIVTARQQLKGKGRSGRAWRSSPGAALYFSGILEWPEQPPGPFFSLACGLAVLDAVRMHCPDSTGLLLKWPNDIIRRSVHAGQSNNGTSATNQEHIEKIGGVLIEGRAVSAGVWQTIVGIGLNWSEAPAAEGGDAFAPGALGCPGQPEDLVPHLVRALNHRAESFEASHTLEEFRNADLFSNRFVRCDDKSGRVVGLNSAGALVLDSGATIEDSARSIELLQEP